MTSLKTRLFGRRKIADEESNRKLSQSASDIAANQDVGSAEDLCSQGNMGSRALSHDSIFLADEDSAEEDPVRVLSQENVHSKIKHLQMKLQQQKLHFGPPPLVVPVRRPEDSGSRSEDTQHAQSPARAWMDLNAQASPIKYISPPSTRPLSPSYKPASIKTVSPSKALPVVSTSAAETGLDLSSPPKTSQCLNTSAARHRISVKPRNQRASTKRRQRVPDPQSSQDSVNNVSFPEKMLTETWAKEKGATDLLVRIESIKPAVAETVVQGKVPDIYGTGLSQKDDAVSGRTFSSISALRVKPQGDGIVTGRPHSSFIASEMMKDLEKLHQDDKRKIQNKLEVDSSDQLSSGHESQHIQGEAENRGVWRNFSIARSAERPRSGSFVGVFGPTGARQKTEETEQPMRENDDGKDARAGQFRLGKLNPEEALHKAVDIQWERSSSLRKVEPVTVSKNPTMDAVVLQVQEQKRNQEKSERTPEVTEEHQEGEGRNAFGFKLRSTNQSVRLWSNLSSRQKVEASEEESREVKKQEETKRRLNYGDIKTTDPPLYGISSPVKQPPQVTTPAPLMPTGVQTTAKETSMVACQDPQPAAPEASWMTLAMEKTRSSFQQLFTSKFPRDKPSNQPQTETSGVQSQSTLYMSPSKNPKDLPSQTSVSQSAPRDVCWTSAVHSPQTSQFSQGSFSLSPPKSLLSGQQQTTWSSGPNSARQFKSTTSLVTKVSGSTPATSSGSWDLPSSSSPRQLGRTGSVSERAAFLERKVERTSSVHIKGVDLKKAETSSSDDSPVSFKRIQIKESKPEERLHAESSPGKVPDRPREEKWLRKNVASASPPSAPGGGQPSWMELAKRKSMAWSDKSMD